MVTLPRMLCQPFVSQHVLNTFSCLAKQQNQLFLANLELQIPSIIGMCKTSNLHDVKLFFIFLFFSIQANLSAIQIAGIDDQFEGKKLIMNLFYWVKTWKGPDDLEQVPDASVREYVQQIVQLKAIAV